MEMETVYVVLISVVGTLAVLVLIGFGSPGVTGPPATGTRVLMRTITQGAFAEKVQGLFAPPKPVKPSGAPLRLLTLMQREGRLIDFMLEDIQQYPPEQNAQIGAGVRAIHKGCQKVLREHLVLKPVMGSASEGKPWKYPSGSSPRISGWWATSLARRRSRAPSNITAGASRKSSWRNRPRGRTNSFSSLRKSRFPDIMCCGKRGCVSAARTSVVR